ncbi:MAG TPA: apolipoprotein N-acyltransferase, partial [Paracoccus sp.]|nr:apolipoprotein N-acyltransferase [Paracoccus sp. (in: a-proteobacteria)]
MPGLLRAPALQAALAGVFTALGQAPWGLWPVTLVALALVMLAVARVPEGKGARAGFWRAWAAGAGGFALAMVWIIEPFFIEPER